MNDRFKFRVWDTITNTYDYKFPYNRIGMFYLAQNGHLFSDFGNTVAPEIKQDRFIIEQCTGLKDKNGKLIYEGDIIKSPWGSLYEIRWDSIQARFQNHCGHLLLDTDIERYEIIGNIHQKDAK